MLISFKCPHCQASLQVGSNFAGKKEICPVCKEALTVPKQDEKTTSCKETPAKQE